ncbi:MAG: WecB/TagA/CpsF family glycosyltransferase [Patescibacteria group bacterium]
MRLNAVKILEISITNLSRKKILEYIQKYLDKKAKNRQKILKIFTPNTEQLVLAKKNPDFANILNRGDLTLPDSSGIIWASQLLTQKPLPELIPGVEFMEDLVSLAAKRAYSVALIGGRGGLAVKTLECLQQEYPRLKGWAEDGPEVKVQSSKLKVKSGKQKLITSAGDQEDYFKQLAQRIRESGARIVFVGLGAPKQELFIEQLVDSLQHIAYRKTEQGFSKRYPLSVNNPLVLMAVGGSFEIISGQIPRASEWIRRLRVPLFMRAIGYEWLWRLVRQPWRIKRQMALVRFIWLVIAKKLRV